MPPRSSRWGRRALLALLAWSAGCEALADGQLGEVHCLAEGAVGPPACPTGSACNSGLCTPTELGAPCVADADCAPSGFCLAPSVFGTSGTSAPSRCSRACCISSDCDPGFVCAMAPSGGGGFCRPASEIGRASGGTGQPMSVCASDADCRSGRCLDQRCLDTCCSDTPCAVDAAPALDAGYLGPPRPAGVCRFTQPSPDEAAGFWCSAPAAGAPRYIECSKDAECASGLCVSFGSIGSFCAPPCCSSQDCGDLVPGVPVRCVTITTPEPLRACGALAGPMADEVVGLPCETDADCLSGICLSSGGRSLCSDACCSDESCGDSDALGCRPTNNDGEWALQCVLK